MRKLFGAGLLAGLDAAAIAAVRYMGSGFGRLATGHAPLAGR